MYPYVDPTVSMLRGSFAVEKMVNLSLLLAAIFIAGLIMVKYLADSRSRKQALGSEARDVIPTVTARSTKTLFVLFGAISVLFFFIAIYHFAISGYLSRSLFPFYQGVLFLIGAIMNRPITALALYPKYIMVDIGGVFHARYFPKELVKSFVFLSNNRVSFEIVEPGGNTKIVRTSPLVKKDLEGVKSAMGDKARISS